MLNLRARRGGGGAGNRPGTALEVAGRGQRARGALRGGGDSGAAVKKGLALLNEGDTPGAKELFLSILDGNPNSAVAHLGIGKAFYAEGDYNKALEHFQEALTLKPDLAQAMLMSAKAHEGLGNTEQALEAYEDATEIDPALGKGHMRMGRLLAKREDSQEAIQHYREALSYNPQQVSARLMLASAYEKAGDSKAAEVELRAAMETSPDNWVPSYQLARIKLRNKEFAEAAQLLEGITDKTSDKAAVQFALGSAYDGLGDQEKAIAAFKQAQSLNPQLLASELQTAKAYVKLGRFDDALRTLQSLAKRKPRSAAVHWRLGDVYVAMGRYKQAIDEYRAVLLNQPDLLEKDPELARLREATGEDEEIAMGFQKRLAVLSPQIAEDAKTTKQRPRQGFLARARFGRQNQD